MIEEMKNRYATYDEISKMYFSEKDLAFIDYGDEEIIGYCSDLPDIIVDINRKLGTRDIKVYSFETGQELLTTYGQYLNTVAMHLREKIIERLIKLQNYEIEINDYKIIDEYDLQEFYDYCEGDEVNEEYEKEE